MKLFNAFLSSISLLAVTAESSNVNSLRGQQPSSQSNDYVDDNNGEVTYLAGTNWAVTDLLINDDLDLEPTLVDSRMLTLHFHEESMTGLADLTGHGGCNSFHSQYELLFGIDFPQAFSVDDRVVSTRRLCEEEIMTQETNFRRVLAQEAIVYQIRADGKELKLYNVVVDENRRSNEGDLMAVLRRIPLDVDANSSIPAVCTSDDQCSPTIRSQVSSGPISGVGGCGCYASSEIDSFDECEGDDVACRTLRCGGDALFCNDMTAFCDIIPGDTMGQCQLGSPPGQSRTIKKVDFSNITHILPIGSDWEATTITVLDTPMPTDDPVTLFIESETSISGYSGCNRFNGALEFLDVPIVNGSPLFQISLTRGRSTRRGCDDARMKLERRFNGILSRELLAYTIGHISDEPYGKQLSLYAVNTDEGGEPSRGELLVEFRRIPPAEDGDFMSTW